MKYETRQILIKKRGGGGQCHEPGNKIEKKCDERGRRRRSVTGKVKEKEKKTKKKKQEE